jgi:hypothetical protein
MASFFIELLKHGCFNNSGHGQGCPRQHCLRINFHLSIIF